MRPRWKAFPPRRYGNIERVVSWLTEELVAQGHDVTLFANGDSHTRAELSPQVRRALSLNGIRNPTPRQNLSRLIQWQGVESRADAAA